MAGTTGLEPATSGVTGQRSNQLNYVPGLGLDESGSSLRKGKAGSRGRPSASQRMANTNSFDAITPRLKHASKATLPYRDARGPSALPAERRDVTEIV